MIALKDNREQGRCPGCGGRGAEFICAPVDFEYAVQADGFDYQKCTSCGLVFMWPRPELATLVSFYPADYHAYQKPDSRLFKILNRMRFTGRANSYRALIGNTGHILDVGCGDGEVMRELGRRGDWSFEGIEFKDSVAQAGIAQGLQVHAGTLETVSIPADSCDLAILNHLIEHVSDPADTFARVLALLKPGGWIVGETPSLDSLEYRLLKSAWAGVHFPRHTQIFSRQSLARMLVGAGFGAVRVTDVLHPGQWAISLQSALIRAGLPLRTRHGKSRLYGPLLLVGIGCTLLERILHRSGVIGFAARKPLA